MMAVNIIGFWTWFKKKNKNKKQLNQTQIFSLMNGLIYLNNKEGGKSITKFFQNRGNKTI